MDTNQGLTPTTNGHEETRNKGSYSIRLRPFAFIRGFYLDEIHSLFGDREPVSIRGFYRYHSAPKLSLNS
jgi:hypothetical protein